MTKQIKTYQNAQNETVLVYPNGMKIRESLAVQRKAEVAASREARKAKLKTEWVAFCEKYGMNPED